VLLNFEIDFEVEPNLKTKLTKLKDEKNKIKQLQKILCCKYENDIFYKCGIIKINLTNLSTKYFELSLKNSNNEESIELLLFDITNYSSFQELNIQKQKGLHLAKIAHDLKNPILVINQLISILKEQSSSKKENITANNQHYFIEKKATKKSSSELQCEDLTDKEKYDLISKLSDYLLLLVEDLNDFVKVEKDKNKINESEFTNINLKEVITFCHSIFKTKQIYDTNKTHLKVKYYIDPTLPKKIYSNEKKLKQVLINLLSNSYKFTTSGTVLVAAKSITNTTGNYVRISVEDSGEGFNDEEQKQLFQPFTMLERTKHLNPIGSGLGLIVVKELINALGSEIKINSVINKGTSFYFDIKIKLSDDKISHHNSSRTIERKIHQNCGTQKFVKKENMMLEKIYQHDQHDGYNNNYINTDVDQNEFNNSSSRLDFKFEQENIFNKNNNYNYNNNYNNYNNTYHNDTKNIYEQFTQPNNTLNLNYLNNITKPKDNEKQYDNKLNEDNTNTTKKTNESKFKNQICLSQRSLNNETVEIETGFFMDEYLKKEIEKIIKKKSKFNNDYSFILLIFQY